MPIWSPDGTRLAFYSKRARTLQLWVLDLKQGRTTQITDIEGGINPDPVSRFSGWDGDPFRYCWSPDGTKIVFTSRIKSGSTQNPEAPPGSSAESSAHIGNGTTTEEEPLILTDATPAAWTLGGLFHGSAAGGDDSEPSNKHPPQLTNQLFVVEVASKKLEQLTKDDDGYFNPDWSPDGTKIVFVSTEGRPMVGYGPDTSNLYAIEVSTGRKTALTVGPGQKRLPCWSPEGKWIAYLGGREFGIVSVYLMLSTGGNPANITAQLDRNTSTFYWSPDGNSIYVSYRDGVSWPIARVSVPGGTVQRISQLEALCQPFAVSRGAVVWVQSDGSSAGVVYTSDSNGRSPRILLEVNPQTGTWALGKQQVVRWQNSRGEAIEGILILPVDYREGRTYPLIVDPYPGLVNGFMSGPMSGNQAFASEGFMIFIPNERTPHTWQNPVKDQRYNEAALGPNGIEIMMDDLMSGIDAVVGRFAVDPDRMCLYGFSNGASAVNLIVTRTSRFKCAVSASGITDWASSFLKSGTSFFPTLIGGMTPWQDPDAYIKLSPVYHLDKVTIPILLAVGDDEGIGVVMEAEMYNGLRYLGRDVTMIRYPNQGHGFTGTALEDYWERVNHFFDKYMRNKHAEANSPSAIN